MKNYLNNLETAKEEMLKDASFLVGAKVTSKKYGPGTITAVTKLIDLQLLNKDQKPDIACKINFDNNSEVEFFINMAMSSGNLTIESEMIQNSLSEIIHDMEPAYVEWQRLYKEEKILLEKKKEEEEQEQLRKKREEKILEKRESQKRNLITLANTLSTSKFRVYDDFYVELGYLAKHTKHIYAAMPDYLESWFVRQFGDVERRVVNSNKVCPSGLPPQFSISFKINLDTNKNMPVSLTKHLSSVEKENRPIADTSYVFELVANHGFQFGKVQDLNAIMDLIPEDRIEDFNLGYNA